MRKLLVVIGILLMCMISNPASAIMIDVGSQTNFYTNDTRGFWFTAPTDFTITGLGLPTDASSANFDISVLRLNEAPPLYSTSTLNFDTLFLSRDNAGPDLLSTNIAIFGGDIIGILGSRGANSTNSYGDGDYLSNILGYDVTLSRFLMQDDLRTTDPDKIGVSTEDSYIGRILVNIDSGASAPVPEPATMLLFGLGLLGIAGSSRKKK